jgi:isoleucyl-tRNA synthetase
VVADSGVARLEPFVGLIAAEVNLKSIELVEATAEVAASHGVTTKLEVNARAAGPRLGRGVQAVIGAVKAGQWQKNAAGQVVVNTGDGAVTLLEGEYRSRTVVEGSAGAGQQAASVLSGVGYVLLDLELSDELEAEGYARDLVRLVQDQRKADGLHVSDRIDLELTVPDARVEFVRAHQAMIQAETLATTLKVTGKPVTEASSTVRKID